MKNLFFALIATIGMSAVSAYAANPKTLKDTKCEKSGKAQLSFSDEDDKELFTKIKTGKITATLRLGQRCFENNANAFEVQKLDKDKKATTVLTATLAEAPYYIKLKDITAVEANAVNATGFQGIKDPVAAAKAQFKHFYKDATDETVLTVFLFKAQN